MGALSGDVLAHVGAFHVDDDTAVHARGGAVHVDVCAARQVKGDQHSIGAERMMGRLEERRTVDVGDVDVARVLRAYVRVCRVALSKAAAAVAHCKNSACMKDPGYGTHLVYENGILHILD